MEEKRPVFYEIAASNGTQEPLHREPSCARPSRSGSRDCASAATRPLRKGNCTENGPFGHFPIRFGAGYVRSTLITLTMHSSRAGLSILAGCDSQVGFPKCTFEKCTDAEQQGGRNCLFVKVEVQELRDDGMNPCNFVVTCLV